jgi:hypothetical protein
MALVLESLEIRLGAAVKHHARQWECSAQQGAAHLPNVDAQNGVQTAIRLG